MLRKAALAADKPPETITTDKLRSYIQPVKDVLPEGQHIQSEGIRANINNNLSERLQGTFRDRIKTLRGLDSQKTGQRYLDGWTLTYNLFRGHHSLGNKTPGERAGCAALPGVGRRGKSRGRVPTGQTGDAAISIVTEVVTAASRPEAQGEHASSCRRKTRGRRREAAAHQNT